MHSGKRTALEMMLWKYLSEDQQKTLLICFLDLKIKMAWKISMMREKIRLVEEKLDWYGAARNMLRGER